MPFVTCFIWSKTEELWKGFEQDSMPLGFVQDINDYGMEMQFVCVLPNME